MNVTEFRDLNDHSRTQTQALYGAQVYILDSESESDWYEIAVPGQASPKNDLWHSGWVLAMQVSVEPHYGKFQSSKPFAPIDKAITVPLYHDRILKSKIMDIYLSTRLPVLKETKSFIKVAVPHGGSAYLSAQDATVYKTESAVPYPTSDDLVNTARKFLGLPYLWNGASAYGVDCSGFTHTINDSHEISIARDASAQAEFTGHGVQVAQDDLQPADLIFYASNSSNSSSI